MLYSELQCSEAIRKAVERMGFAEMTEIQEKTIPVIKEMLSASLLMLTIFTRLTVSSIHRKKQMPLPLNMVSRLVPVASRLVT